MPRHTQSTFALVIGLGLLIAVDGWLRVADRVGYSLPSGLSRPFLREALQRQTTMRAEMAATVERGRRARELAMAVMEGRLTLHEGAARLRALYAAPPQFPWEMVHQQFPGASDEECCCRLLIGQLRTLEGPNRELARAVAIRLEIELDSELRGYSLSEPA
jgi:hypothetical protein